MYTSIDGWNGLRTLVHGGTFCVWIFPIASSIFMVMTCKIAQRKDCDKDNEYSFHSNTVFKLQREIDKALLLAWVETSNKYSKATLCRYVMDGSTFG